MLVNGVQEMSSQNMAPWHSEYFKAEAVCRKVFLTFPSSFSPEASHKTFIWDAPSPHPEGRNTLISNVEEHQEDLKRLVYYTYPSLLHLPHTLCPITFFQDCPPFIKTLRKLRIKATVLIWQWYLGKSDN